MSKKFNNLKWGSVALEGFPVSMTDKFQGFVGLEECTDYSYDKENKRSKKKEKLKEWKEKAKARKERKKRTAEEIIRSPITNKKVKLSNGFVVESCDASAPSLTNDLEKNNNVKRKPTIPTQKQSIKNINNNPSNKTKIEKQNTNKSQTSKKNNIMLIPKKVKLKLGDLPQSTSDLTAEDMLSWAEFKLQEPIMRALTELGFKQPTKIQQMTLPAAIHGRRDILGAAETGSGKTLAFGLPILSGILKLKEKAEIKGLDVYDIPYKKGSSKKKNIEVVETNKFQKGREVNRPRKKKEEIKESSEDGYSSGEENNESGGENRDTENSAEVDESETESGESAESDENGEIEQSEDENEKQVNKEDYKDDDYLEEIEVPIRKKVPSTDEGNDSDDDDNYIHLSDMLDSDDLAESSDDDGEKNEDKSSEDCSDIEGELDNDVIDSDINNENDDNSAESDVDSDDVDENEQDEVVDETGMGCVKVVDNIEIPGHMVVKTGKPLYALILTPTRELAIQISRHLIAAAKYTGIKVATIVGGMAAVKQERVLRCGPEIVVATPGRLWQLIGQGQHHLQQLNTVKFLAIDETDRMIERGHFEELYPLLERLNADDDRRAARQNFVFSATLTMVHDLPSHMKGKKVTKNGKILNRKIEKMSPQQKVNRLVKMIGMTEPKVVDITQQNSGTAETLTESRITCAHEHKDAYLYYIVKRHPGRTIVFCNSIGSVKRLAQLFTLLKCRPLPLHANMQQRQRLKNLERFRDDPHGILVATDVAARGLDIPHVEHVVHYQVPRTAENYVHRSGRTARAAREGLTILVMEPTEAFLYAKLCRTLNKTSELPTFPVDPQILAPLKDLVSLARELDSLELKKRRAAQSVGWKERAAREMDIIIDDDDVPTKQVDNSIDKALKVKKRQFQSMLSRPLYPRGFSFKYPTLNDPNALVNTEENALQVMKKAIESGQLKKEKRKSKNAPLLQLQKKFKKNK